MQSLHLLHKVQRIKIFSLKWFGWRSEASYWHWNRISRWCNAEVTPHISVYTTSFAGLPRARWLWCQNVDIPRSASLCFKVSRVIGCWTFGYYSFNTDDTAVLMNMSCNYLKRAGYTPCSALQSTLRFDYMLVSTLRIALPLEIL